MIKKNRKIHFKREEQEFEQKIVDLARVTRVMAGGKRLRFRATVVVGDKKSRISIGVGKGADVSLAISKAVAIAKKNMINTPIFQDTIPCEIKEKYGAAVVFLKPAKQGTGIIAGGAVRTVLELSGLQNVVSKIYGSKNKINNVKATIRALKRIEKMVVKKQVLFDKKNKKSEVIEKDSKTAKDVKKPVSDKK